MRKTSAWYNGNLHEPAFWNGVKNTPEDVSANLNNPDNRKRHGAVGLAMSCYPHLLVGYNTKIKSHEICRIFKALMGIRQS